MVIFFKKGNRKDIKNYRPICLLSNMYKLFTNIISTRLEKKLHVYENQPREQAGFRSKYSTTDHIHAINQGRATLSERGPDETFQSSSWAGVTNETPKMK